MPIHNTSYQHWDGVHRNIWQRRAVVAGSSLTACLRVKLLRNVVFACWMTALGATAVLFALGQLLVADSPVVQWVGNFNPQLQDFVKMLTTWLEKHPEISVRTTQNVAFYFYAMFLLRLSIFALGMGIPHLITRDLACHAIVVYYSKAINRWDYLLGKFCAAFGLLALTWLGPLLAAWFLGNLLGPDWGFFWHSRAALGHILLFGLPAMAALSLLALGCSASSLKEKNAAATWLLWWILAGVLVEIGTHTRPWLCHLSFNYNLEQIALGVFHPGADLKLAQDSIPLLGMMLGNVHPETIKALNAPTISGAVVGLGLLLIGAVYILHQRVKPE